MAEKKKSHNQDSNRQDALPLMPPVRKLMPLQLALVLLTSVVLLGITWARPRACGDFFVGLAGGRDIVETRLACLTEPDTWSFIIPDQINQIWFDQNWGTHVLFYLTWIAGGEWGELILKATLLLIMAAAIMMRVRDRGVDWPIAILSGAATVGAMRAFIDMRPNLITLAIAPVMAWLIVRSRHNPHRIWWALPLSLLWSSMHGGFVLGLGMLGLWAMCWLVGSIITDGIGPALRKYWPLPAVTVLAILASMFLSPFGWRNLYHPLVVGTEPEWRGISEWLPIHQGNFGSTWEFFTTMSLLTGLAAIIPMVLVLFGRVKPLRLKMEHLAVLAYSIVLCVILFALGMKWRPEERFEVHHAVLLTVTILVIIVGTSFGLLVWFKLMRDRKTGGKELNYERARSGDYAAIIFELALAAVVILMGIKARRFIPLATVLVAPIAIVEAEWIYRAINRWWVLAIVAVVLLVPCFYFPENGTNRAPVPHLARAYDPNNPFEPPLSPFERMLLCKNYPYEGTEFIAANDISGRVYHDWRWEGFLRWRTPQLKVFVGGRAQQVYDLDSFHLIQRILNQKEHQTLSKMGVHLAVIRDQGSYGVMAREMVKADWAYIFWNDGKMILADAKSPETKELILRAAKGQLKYPSPETAAWSRAMCLASGGDVRTTWPDLANAIIEANRLHPRVRGYNMLWRLNANRQFPTRNFIAYLESEYARLGTMNYNSAGGRRFLACRDTVADMLFKLHGRAGRKQQADKWGREAEFVRNELNKLHVKWGKAPLKRAAK